jgi:hypothetical protein
MKVSGLPRRNAKLVRDHQALISAINEQVNIPPVAVLLDTLNRSIDGSESKDADMGAYLSAADAIVEEFAAAMCMVMSNTHKDLPHFGGPQMATSPEADASLHPPRPLPAKGGPRLAKGSGLHRTRT